MSNPETHQWTVFTNDSDTPRTIEAAYYAHEDEFTVFKAESGKILASFANRHIVGIEREVVARATTTYTTGNSNFTWTVTPVTPEAAKWIHEALLKLKREGGKPLGLA